MAALHSTAQMLPRTATATEAASLENRGPILFVTCVVLMAIAIIVMIARIYCRAILLKQMGSDDWCMIAATISAVGLVVSTCLSVSRGYGKHQWVLSWQDSALTLKFSYIGETFYFVALGFCKASLILFIIRLQPSRRMVIISWFIFCFCAASSFASSMATCLQCFPTFPWEELNPNVSGNINLHCVNQKALQLTLPSINIFTDFVVWILPIKMIWKVQLPKRQKWGLIAVFSLGGLGVLSGILRFWRFLTGLRTVEDLSWSFLDFTLWANVEVLISIIFGSAPAVKPFFSRYLPGLLGSSSLKSYTRSSTRFPSASHSRTKSRIGRSNAYALESISGRGGVSQTEHSSTEEFRMGGIATRVDAPGRGDSGEYHGVLGGIVKSTGVHVLVEERV